MRQSERMHKAGHDSPHHVNKPLPFLVVVANVIPAWLTSRVETARRAYGFQPPVGREIVIALVYLRVSKISHHGTSQTTRKPTKLSGSSAFMGTRAEERQSSRRNQ